MLLCKSASRVITNKIDINKYASDNTPIEVNNYHHCITRTTPYWASPIIIHDLHKKLPLAKFEPATADSNPASS